MAKPAKPALLAQGAQGARSKGFKLGAGGLCLERAPIGGWILAPVAPGRLRAPGAT